MLCARVLLQRAQAVILAQLAEAIAKAIVEDMAVLHKWYIYYNSKYAAPPAPACPRAAALTPPCMYYRLHLKWPYFSLK